MEEVSPFFWWRAWPTLIDEDSEVCSARFACRGLLRGFEEGEGRLTTRCHGYIILDKSDEDQDALLRVEIGMVGIIGISFILKSEKLFGGLA